MAVFTCDLPKTLPFVPVPSPGGVNATALLPKTLPPTAIGNPGGVVAITTGFPAQILTVTPKTP